MARKPRILTETAHLLREVASMLTTGTPTVAQISDAANRARAQADKLDRYDAREDKLQPSVKRQRKATKKRR